MLYAVFDRRRTEPMKKVWKIRKDQEAVSPVIATILMVAITVVLAAVLYVMVAGLIGGGGTSRPAVTLDSARSTGTNSWKVAIADASQTVSLGSYKAMLQRTTSGTTTTLVSATTVVNGAIGSSGSVFLNYTDLTGDGKLNGGDYFTVQGASTGSTYTVILIWAADNSQLTSRDILA